MSKNARDDLKNFKTEHISVLEPKFERKKGYRYSHLNDGGSLSEQIRFLRECHKNSLLTETDGVTALQCPDCSSNSLCVTYRCQLCSSSNIFTGIAIEHHYCSNIDFDYKFISRNGSAVCWKCGQSLGSRGRDYSSLGTYYKCCKCGALLPNVSFQYQCFECGRASTQDEMNGVRLGTYSVNHEILNEIIDPAHSFDPMIFELKKLGINAVQNGTTTGLSKIKHTFPLIVYGDSEFPLLVVEIIDSSNGAESSLLSFIARCADIKILKKVVVFETGVDASLRQLAEINNIIVVESKNTELVPPELVEIVKQSVHKAPEIA